MWERAKAEADQRPRPQTLLSGTHEADLHDRVTYIVDSTRTKVTRLEVDTEERRKQRNDAKQLGLAPVPPAAAQEVRIVGYSPEFIVAVNRAPCYVTVYSFYPKFGMMFEMSQDYDLTGPTATQGAWFAKCDFSWSGKP